MTIDEAIAKYKEITNADANCPAHCNISCDKCVQESEQLAEWLEDYKRIKMLIPIEQALKNEYNKAIDDYTEKIKENISESLIWGMIANCFKYKNMNDTSDKIVDYVINTANEIAEQLKAGGADETVL